MREFLLRGFGLNSLPARFSVTLMNEPHHVLERRSREEDFVHAFSPHNFRVLMRNRSSSAAKNLDVMRAFLAEKIDNLGEEFDVTAVVTRNCDRPHVFLDCGAADVANGSMITEINDFDPVANELEIDRVDRAIVPVTNRDRS